MTRDSRDKTLNTERRTDRQMCMDYTDVYKVLHFSLIGCFLSLSLSLSSQSSQLSIAMTCKSVKDYKYSIASLQSATEISVDNLLKQTKFSVFLFLLVTSWIWIFLPLLVWHSVELSLVRSKHNIKYYLKS